MKDADYFFSIVPPRDAVETAKRIGSAWSKDVAKRPSQRVLYYLDLNAISPATTRSIEELLIAQCSSMRFVDGAIIGGPPRLKPASEGASNGAAPEVLYRPSIPLSGPYSLAGSEGDVAPKDGEHLSSVLNSRHVARTIGSASGLKACFASLSKGFTALAIQSFSTAARLGVQEELLDHMAENYPAAKQQAERGLTGMPHKAYRWIREMEEIGATFQDDGLWPADANIFTAVAQVYDVVSEDTTVGKERRKGAELAEVVTSLREGLEKRQQQQ